MIPFCDRARDFTNEAEINDAVTIDVRELAFVFPVTTNSRWSRNGTLRRLENFFPRRCQTMSVSERAFVPRPSPATKTNSSMLSPVNVSKRRPRVHCNIVV
jgi:hypothetical protein